MAEDEREKFEQKVAEKSVVPGLKVGQASLCAKFHGLSCVSGV